MNYTEFGINAVSIYPFSSTQSIYKTTMKISFLITSALSAALAALLMTGCASNSPQAEKAGDAASTSTNANKKAEVKDSSKADAEKGSQVVGINGREGEIIGRPAGNSKFKSLQIGMSMRQATDIAGQPTDQGAYITGKAFIPFYFGGDKHRFELAYKGQGRLIFAGDSAWNGMGSTGSLIKIVNDPKDSGYR